MSKKILNALFKQHGNAKPKRSLFYKQRPVPRRALDELNELILSPLKNNIKKDILARAQKQAPQTPLSDAIYFVNTYVKKNKLNLENLLTFNSSYYNLLNKEAHSHRVLFYVMFLCVIEGINVNDFIIMCDAAKLHDLGRNTPGTDLMHGQKSVGLIKFYNLINYENTDDYNALLAVIDAHSAYDKNIEGVLNKYDIPLSHYERVKKMCYILKDAEALDKVRFFNDSAINTERMLKTNLLKNKTAKKMVALAFELNEHYVIKIKENPREFDDRFN